MYGGDSLFGRMTSTTHVYRDSGVDSELDHRAYRVIDKLSESINTIANEPSVAFYRIQEHVRKTLPQLVEQKHEVEEVQQLVQGACFDTEYAGNAVKAMEKSVVHFQNIQELLKNAMFMKQQIDYEEARKRQNRLSGSNGRPEGPGGVKTEEGSNTNMDDSAVSTDSSLVASGHANTEENDQVPVTTTEKEPTDGDTQQEKDAAEITSTHQETSAIDGDEKLEDEDVAEEDDRQKVDTAESEEKKTEECQEKQQVEDFREQESTLHGSDSASNPNADAFEN